MKNESMILMIRAKKSGDIIGLKEDIAMRLAGVMDIERIDVAEDAAAVVEIKHGEWVLLDECANEGVYCSVCHKKVYKINYANQNVNSNFCPNCGAKMDGERKEK